MMTSKKTKEAEVELFMPDESLFKAQGSEPRAFKQKEEPPQHIPDLKINTPLIEKSEANNRPEVGRGEAEIHNRKKDLSIKDKFIDKFFPSTLLVNMELRNGDHVTFLVNTNNESFSYCNARYIIDTEIKYYSRTGKTYCLDYHQDYSLPIRRKFNVKDIKEAIKLSGVIEIEEASNPSLIQEFVDREVMKQLMKGQDIDDMLKQIKLPLYITCAVCVIHLLIFVAKSGMLQQAKFW